MENLNVFLVLFSGKCVAIKCPKYLNQLDLWFVEGPAKVVQAPPSIYACQAKALIGLALSRPLPNPHRPEPAQILKIKKSIF